MAVVSQPDDMDSTVAQPGEIDPELGEFWVGNPWEIFRRHNLSAFERNRLFLNAGGGRLLDVSAVAGVDDDGDGRASVPVDFDHDGDQDLVVRQAGGKTLIAYRNRLSAGNHLRVTLRGRRSNRLGIGARVVASVDGRTIVRELFPTNTHLSRRALVVHLGLGAATHVDEVRIDWPSGARQTLTGLPANVHVVVTEDASKYSTRQPGRRIEP